MGPFLWAALHESCLDQGHVLGKAPVFVLWFFNGDTHLSWWLVRPNQGRSVLFLLAVPNSKLGWSPGLAKNDVGWGGGGGARISAEQSFAYIPREKEAAPSRPALWPGRQGARRVPDQLSALGTLGFGPARAPGSKALATVAFCCWLTSYVYSVGTHGGRRTYARDHGLFAATFEGGLGHVQEQFLRFIIRAPADSPSDSPLRVRRHRCVERSVTYLRAVTPRKHIPKGQKSPHSPQLLHRWQAWVELQTGRQSMATIPSILVLIYKGPK